jgi:hypothetical protein
MDRKYREMVRTLKQESARGGRRIGFSIAEDGAPRQEPAPRRRSHWLSGSSQRTASDQRVPGRAVIPCQTIATSASSDALTRSIFLLSDTSHGEVLDLRRYLTVGVDGYMDNELDLQVRF